jgi:hypothetical protein
MYDDKRRLTCSERVDKFIQEKLTDPSLESKVRCTVAITTLLNNATDLGQGQVNSLDMDNVLDPTKHCFFLLRLARTVSSR